MRRKIWALSFLFFGTQDLVLRPSKLFLAICTLILRFRMGTQSPLYPFLSWVVDTSYFILSLNSLSSDFTIISFNLHFNACKFWGCWKKVINRAELRGTLVHAWRVSMKLLQRFRFSYYLMCPPLSSYCRNIQINIT